MDTTNQGVETPETISDADTHPDTSLENQAPEGLEIKYVHWIGRLGPSSILGQIFLTCLILYFVGCLMTMVAVYPVAFRTTLPEWPNGNGTRTIHSDEAQGTEPVLVMMGHILCLCFGLVNPLFVVVISRGLLLSKGQLIKEGVVIGAIFGLWYLVTFGFFYYLTVHAGWTGVTIGAFKTIKGCDSRVSPQQVPVFATMQYVYDVPGDWGSSPINLLVAPQYWMQKEHFDIIRNDKTLCGQGFIGNVDLYGLGIRIGMYLQWFSALLTNNLLPKSNKALQSTYLPFSLAICVATLVLTFNQACVFATEIEILYWMYWGGVVCVYISSPSRARLSLGQKWRGLNGFALITVVSHMLMMLHAAGFTLFWFQQTFARLPCGTYHFLLAPVLDPSRAFDVFKASFYPYAVFSSFVLVIACPAIALIMIADITIAEKTNSPKESTIYRLLFIRSTRQSNRHLLQIPEETQQNPHKVWLRIVRGMKSLLLQVWVCLMMVPRTMWKGLWFILGLPSEAQRVIYLVTPFDVKERRQYRIGLAVLGTISLVLSITAIECSLKWNKITGVYSLNSTGQWITLVIGIASCFSTVWEILKQEDRRRRRKAVAAVSEDGIELQPMLSGSFAYAFSQPDEEFFASDDALPSFTSDTFHDIPQPPEVDPSSASQQEMANSLVEEDLYTMSGALPDPSDSENAFEVAATS